MDDYGLTVEVRHGPGHTLVTVAGKWISPPCRDAQRGASLHAVCARHQVRRLFTITGLDRQIPLAHTVTEACQKLATARSEALQG